MPPIVIILLIILVLLAIVVALVFPGSKKDIDELNEYGDIEIEWIGDLTII